LEALLTVYDLVLRSGQAGTTKGVVPIDVRTGAIRSSAAIFSPNRKDTAATPLSIHEAHRDSKPRI